MSYRYTISYDKIAQPPKVIVSLYETTDTHPGEYVDLGRAKSFLFETGMSQSDVENAAATAATALKDAQDAFVAGTSEQSTLISEVEVIEPNTDGTYYTFV